MGGVPRIYLICDQTDLEAARPVEDFLFDQGFEQHGRAEVVDAGVALDLVHGLSGAGLGSEMVSALAGWVAAQPGVRVVTASVEVGNELFWYIFKGEPVAKDGGETGACQPATDAAPGTDDKLAQLKELGELKTSGVLTEAEFEDQKAKILAG